jgi:hypothetical protein
VGTAGTVIATGRVSLARYHRPGRSRVAVSHTVA